MGLDAALREFGLQAPPADVVGALPDLSPATQDAFLAARPVSAAQAPLYTRRVLALVLETAPVASDALCEELASCLAEGDGEATHLSYRVAPATWLTLRSVARRNEVGLRLWPAARLLGEWLLGRSWRGRRVVELGAGVGLCGLCCALRDADSVVLTDADPAVLDNLRYTTEALNAGLAPRTRVLALDWADFGDLRALLGPTDLVLAADCVYDPAAAPALAALCRAFADNFPAADLVLANAIRTRETWAACLRAFADRGLRVEPLHDGALPLPEEPVFSSARDWADLKRQVHDAAIALVAVRKADSHLGPGQ